MRLFPKTSGKDPGEKVLVVLEVPDLERVKLMNRLIAEQKVAVEMLQVARREAWKDLQGKYDLPDVVNVDWETGEVRAGNPGTRDNSDNGG